MTMFDSRLLFIPLVVLAPSLGSNPGPDELPDKLQDLLGQLEAAKQDFQCIFDIIDEQCPCWVPGDPDCFETAVLEINSTLCDLISDLNGVIADQPDDCPPLEGCAALVAGCNSSEIAVVDPVGTILPSIDVKGSVCALFVHGADQTDYTIFYITNDPFSVFALDLPEGTTRDFNNGLIDTGSGIVGCEGNLYYALEDASGNSAIYLGNINLINISCPGQLRCYEGLLYYSDCEEIYCVNASDPSSSVAKVKFPVDIKSFDVIDNGKSSFIMDTIVFCDAAGGLWIYDIDTGCYKLLYCNAEQPCCDVKINRCSWLIYVVYPDDPELYLFNHTTCASAGTLTYTTSIAKEFPRLEFEPPCDSDQGAGVTTTTTTTALP